jgi:lipid-binding SYLF domain-containing protein
VSPSSPSSRTERRKHKLTRPALLSPLLLVPGGLAIYTSFRTAIAPFGGAGGAGVIIARLPDGSWSGPSCMSPNNLTTGFMIGVDIYDAILVIRTPEALKSFGTHNATLGTDVAVTAGPFGAGAAAE